MSLASDIQRISDTSGIEAVVVWSPSSRVDAGTVEWHSLLAASIDLLAFTDGPEWNVNDLRLVVGKHTIIVQREESETIAIVFPTGHAVAKSVRRTIRRAARK